MCMRNMVLDGVGILLLLAAAFDVLPLTDNLVIFLVLACFIISAIVKKAIKGINSCCVTKNMRVSHGKVLYVQ